MSQFEDKTRVFVIRIWFESQKYKCAVPQWRGSIHHVFDDKKQYFTDLNAITDYISPYLDDSGRDDSHIQSDEGSP